MPARYVGTSVQRVEDERILTGRGRYVNDVMLPDMLHAAFVRSPHAHARIVRIDTRAAAAMPRVAAIYTATDLQAIVNPISFMGGPQGYKSPTYLPLTADKARFVGDPIAMVVAEDRYVAEDACDAIIVEYEVLPAISTIEQALDPTRPSLFDDFGTNVVYQDSATYGDVDAAFAQADRTVHETFSQHRYAHVPIETRGGVADFNPGTGELTYHATTQSPHAFRFMVAGFIRQPIDKMRVIARDVGGSFGLKAFIHREEVAICAASKQLGRPVKWIEDRREHLMASGHAREETVDVEIAVKNDGTLLGMKAKQTTSQGAYPLLPLPPPLFPTLVGIMLPGPYRWAAFSFDNTVVNSNKAAYIAYRGPWEMETWVRERMLDIVARELQIDPVEIRRRNLVTAEEQPTKMLTGPTLERVTCRQTTERALELADLPTFREAQRRARAEHRYLGFGMATFIEAAPGPRDGMAMGTRWGQSTGLGGLGGERAHVRVEPDGSVTVITAQMPHGQGHETTLAQVAADELGVAFEQVTVIYGDTRFAPFSFLGTGGSRAATMASGAVLYAARAVKQQIVTAASAMLEANPADIVIDNGMVTVQGVPGKMLPLMQIAMMAYMAPAMLPPGVGPGLEGTFDFDGGEGGWSQATHCCWVEVDAQTGTVRLDRYLVVEDCGKVINPAIVAGQIRGGVAQGIGGVLLEHMAYDDDARLLADTLQTYLLPTSSDIPTIEIVHLETPSIGPINPRGVGEAGAIAAPATVGNAIADALVPFGAKLGMQPLTPTRILEEIAAAG